MTHKSQRRPSLLFWHKHSSSYSILYGPWSSHSFTCFWSNLGSQVKSAQSHALWRWCNIITPYTGWTFCFAYLITDQFSQLIACFPALSAAHTLTALHPPLASFPAACTRAFIITASARAFFRLREKYEALATREVCNGSSSARPPANLSLTRLKSCRGRRNVHPAAFIVRTCLRTWPVHKVFRALFRLQLTAFHWFIRRTKCYIFCLHHMNLTAIVQVPLIH